MDTEERDHLIQLRCAHVKRLRVLELKQAKMGMDAPEHIFTDIDELSEKVASIDAKLNGSGVTPAISGGSSQMARIEVKFQGDFASLTPELQRAMIRAIAALAEIPPEQVQVLKIMSGSIIFQLEVPKEAAEQLTKLYKTRDAVIEEMGIEHIRIVQTPKMYGLEGVYQQSGNASNKDKNDFTYRKLIRSILDDTIALNRKSKTLWQIDIYGIEGCKYRADRIASRLQYMSSTLAHAGDDYRGHIRHTYRQELDEINGLMAETMRIIEAKSWLINQLSALPLLSWSVKGVSSLAQARIRSAEGEGR